MNKKEFKTLEEQLSIFKLKGLIINDEEFAREVLLLENYFFINGYRHIFLVPGKERKFIKGTTFEELYQMFTFDRNIRNILFKNLLIVENNIKSILSYQLSKKYGYREKDYLKPSNFTTDNKEQRRVNDVITKMKRQIRINGQKHTATYHYINNYGYVPLWILVKVLSFGLINELYGILKPEDKQELAKYYNIDTESLEVYLNLLANYRNLCAHEDLVFDHRSQRSISDNRFHVQLKINKTNDEYIYGKNDIFALIIILKQMLQKDKFDEMLVQISDEFVEFDNNVDTIKIEKLYDKMGFPSNYMDIINIK
jgi:abortive infection bacteriophage resistance protein